MNIAQKTRSNFLPDETDLQRDVLSPEQVESALRLIPSHGWPTGWTGRRRRAELVLTALAHIPRQHIQEMIAGDVTVVEDTAVIAAVEGTVTLQKAEETLLCGPCALARWLHALDLMTMGPERVVAATIARAAPLHDDSPHLCHSPLPIAATTRLLPLFPRRIGGAGASAKGDAPGDRRAVDNPGNHLNHLNQRTRHGDFSRPVVVQSAGDHPPEADQEAVAFAIPDQASATSAPARGPRSSAKRRWAR